MSAYAAGTTNTTALLNQKTLFVGAAPPANQADGQLWFDTVNNVLKQYRSDDGTWHQVGALPAQSKLSGDYTATGHAFGDTGLTLTTTRASLIFGTLQSNFSGTETGPAYRLVTTGATTFYYWMARKNGTDDGSANYKQAAFNGDLGYSLPTAAFTLDIILIGYTNGGATVKIQSRAGLSDGNTVLTKTNSQLVAIPN